MRELLRETAVVSSSSQRFTVKVITERCKECGICIEVCPTKVLVRGERTNSRGYRYVVPEYIDRCIGCRMCEWSCPDLAIFVTEVSKR